MYFLNNLPLEKDGSLHLNPLHPRILCAMFVWNWSSGSGEEDVESLRQIRRRQRTTDKLQSEKLTWAFGSGGLKSFVWFFLEGEGVFIVPLENYSHIWRRHHCRWRAANFDLCSALMAIEQWGFFSVPHLLWHGASIYDGHLRGPVTHPYCRAFGSGAVTICFYDLWLRHCRGRAKKYLSFLAICIVGECRGKMQEGDAFFLILVLLFDKN